MKIAVLMLVHKNKKQLLRLLSAMQHECFDFFIHIDKKSDLDLSDLHMPNVHVIEPRYDVGLFEFSMVDAEIALIRAAQQQGNYEYFLLMSGQCYPVVSADCIYEYLCAHYPEPYVEIVASTEDNYVKRNFQKVIALKGLKIRSYAWLKRHFSFRTFRILRYLPGGLAMLGSWLKGLFVKSPVKRLQKRGLSPYCGSQWWILPNNVIKNVSAFFDDRQYRSIVNDCFSCDETFFQTAIMAQKEENGICTDEGGNYMNRKWFFIFDDGHPILLTKDHYRDIVSSGMLFARKFEIDQDSDILNLLDQNKQ